MRKFKTANPIQISERLKQLVADRRVPLKQATQDELPPTEEDFEFTMSRAFPEHLRGSISGCCDSMQEGHGNH